MSRDGNVRPWRRGGAYTCKPWPSASSGFGDPRIGFPASHVLALGSPSHPIPDDAWAAWTRNFEQQWSSRWGLPYVHYPPLFIHQYSHVWIDFRGIQDAFMRGKGIDYFENSRRATYAQRAYAAANPGGFRDYSVR